MDEEQAIKTWHVQQLSPDIVRVKGGGNSTKLCFTNPISVRVPEELFSLLKVHITPSLTQIKRTKMKAELHGNISKTPIDSSSSEILS